MCALASNFDLLSNPVQQPAITEWVYPQEVMRRCTNWKHKDSFKHYIPNCKRTYCPVHGRIVRNQKRIKWESSLPSPEMLFLSWIVHFERSLYTKRESKELTAVFNGVKEAVEETDKMAEVRAVTHWRDGLPHFHVGIWLANNTSITTGTLQNSLFKWLHKHGRGFAQTERKQIAQKLCCKELWDSSKMTGLHWHRYVCKGFADLAAHDLPPRGIKYARFWYGYPAASKITPVLTGSQ